MRIGILVLLSFALVCAPDSSSAIFARASVECAGEQHVVRIQGYVDVNFDPPFQGFFLERQAVGICESSVVVPAELVSVELIPEGGSFFSFEAVVTLDSPSTNVTYRYWPLAVMEDGTLERTYYYCDAGGQPYGYSGCGLTPIARGTLEYDFEGWQCVDGIRVVPCPEDCWSVQITASLLAIEDALEEPLEDLIGQVVDVFADPANCAMLCGESYRVSSIRRAPEGRCAPVPVQDASWGRLKAIFR